MKSQQNRIELVTRPAPQPQQPMTMHDQAEAARLAQDYEALVSIIKQWNANRLDLFALTLPNEVRDRHYYFYRRGSCFPK